MKVKPQVSFEASNEEIRSRDFRKKNLIKWNVVNQSEEPFHVGSLELQDPYGDGPVYTPSKEYLAEIEEKEKTARQQIEDMSNGDADIKEEVFDSSAMSEEELNLANEIYQRLMNEAAADEMAKQAEIEAIKMQQEATSADYNAETGSYSGLYGKKPMNQDEADALASIMNTNSSYSKSIEELILENQ